MKPTSIFAFSRPSCKTAFAGREKPRGRICHGARRNRTAIEVARSLRANYGVCSYSLAVVLEVQTLHQIKRGEWSPMATMTSDVGSNAHAISKVNANKLLTTAGRLVSPNLQL